jgi:hypothetical protein
VPKKGDEQLNTVGTQPQSPLIIFIMSDIQVDISLDIEFGGGLELLFSNKRHHAIEVPSRIPVDNLTDEAGNDVNLSYLIRHLRLRVLKERAELFSEVNEGRETV